MHTGVTAGIVAEYNPFHKGHEWMIHQLRQGGIGAVVVVLSGPFVQRAEPALFPVYTRVKAALAGGADLVLRLPVPWATASAERFACGAAGLLSALGCVDVLAFGAEEPDVEKLERTAALLLRDDFKTVLKNELAKGVSFAAARAAAAEKLLPGAGKILQSPNNILGVEYCKALRTAVPEELKKKMPRDVKSHVVADLYGKAARQEDLFSLPVPLAMPRVGAAHGGQPGGGYASAGWLRNLAQGEGISAMAPYVPGSGFDLYEKAAAEGHMIDLQRWQIAQLSRLRGKTTTDFARHPGAGEGLEARLAGAARKAVTLEELYSYAKSKRFAHSRVRRLALAAALNIPAGLPPVPPFAQLLGASEAGLRLLRKCKQKALVPLSGSLAKLSRSGEEAARVAALEAAAEDLYALCMQAPAAGGAAYTTPIALVPRQALPGQPHGEAGEASGEEQ